MRSGLKVAACPPSAEEEEGIGCFLLFDLHFSEEALHISGSTTASLMFTAWRGWGDPELLFGELKAGKRGDPQLPNSTLSSDLCALFVASRTRPPGLLAIPSPDPPGPGPPIVCGLCKHSTPQTKLSQFPLAQHFPISPAAKQPLVGVGITSLSAETPALLLAARKGSFDAGHPSAPRLSCSLSRCCGKCKAWT